MDNVNTNSDTWKLEWPEVGTSRSCVSTRTSLFGQLMKEKSKSAKISCCSAVRMQGVRGRVRTGLRRVNSSSKLLTSCAALMTGRNGGFTFLARRASQSIPCPEKMVYDVLACCLDWHRKLFDFHKVLGSINDNISRLSSIDITLTQPDTISSFSSNLSLPNPPQTLQVCPRIFHKDNINFHHDTQFYSPTQLHLHSWNYMLVLLKYFKQWPNWGSPHWCKIITIQNWHCSVSPFHRLRVRESSSPQPYHSSPTLNINCPHPPRHCNPCSQPYHFLWGLL